jgi:putative endonuclease
MFTVYVLYSEKFDKTYVGFTADLEQRLLSHNVLGKKGYTIKFRPWTLIHTETFDLKKDAMIREKQLKTGQGREWIRTVLIPRFYK